MMMIISYIWAGGVWPDERIIDIYLKGRSSLCGWNRSATRGMSHSFKRARIGTLQPYWSLWEWGNLESQELVLEGDVSMAHTKDRLPSRKAVGTKVSGPLRALLEFPAYISFSWLFPHLKCWDSIGLHRVGVATMSDVSEVLCSTLTTEASTALWGISSYLVYK